MSSKRPYKHILKNLLHEQATEIIPLLLPGFQVVKVLDIEMPELKSTYVEGPVDEMEQGFVKLVLPEAVVEGVYETEWIEHSGTFERAYRVQSPETDTLSYMLIEFQTEPDDEDLPLRLLKNFARVNLFAANGIEQEDEDVEDEDFEQDDEEIEDEQDDEESEGKQEHKGTIINRGFSVYPEVLCPFPRAEPAPVRETFRGELILSFNFFPIRLWEKDAREFLNTHVSASYFLLPVMKNADATLLRLAIEELAQRFQGDDRELGRHLTGLNLLLHQSEMMLEEEKQVALEYLKRYAHLIKHDPYEG